jgi:hypothetical protein
MPVKILSKIGDEIITFSKGQNSYPFQGDVILWAPSNQRFFQTGRGTFYGYSDSGFEERDQLLGVYGITESSYRVFTGEISSSEPRYIDEPLQYSSHGVFDGGVLHAVSTSIIRTNPDQKLTLDFGGGFLPEGISDFNLGGLISGSYSLAGWDIGFFASPTIFTDSGPIPYGAVFNIRQSSEDFSTLYMAYPNGGTVEFKKAVVQGDDVNKKFGSDFDPQIIYNGSQYYTFGSFYNIDFEPYGPAVAIFTPVDIVDPQNATIYDIDFGDVNLNLNMSYANYFTYDGYIYGFSNLDQFYNPMPPVMVKMNMELTEFIEIEIQGNDPETVDILNSGFAYISAGDNCLLLAGGDGLPQYYGISGDAGPILDRSLKNPSPYFLPCVTNCIPFFRS